MDMPSERSRRRIPDATVARLPIYLRLLSEQADDGVESISSDRLAELGGVNAAKVRKDLSYLGSYGTRGVGYEVAYLVYQIRRELGLTHDWPVVIVGAGNLGQALAGYGGFGERGFPVAGVVDIDVSKVGSVLSGVRVRHIDELAQIVQAKRVRIGVVATPGAAAQDAAERLVAAGVTSILNFAPVVLTVPRTIEVRKVDLAVELQILSYYEQRRAGAAIHAIPGGLGAGAGPHRSASA
jgi:redox-sensing transcriptional repressor